MRGLNNNSGVALLAVLAVISVLMAAALELARTTGRSAIETGRAADRFQAREKASAGIQLALAILTEDVMTSDIDSLQEDWADPEKLKDAVAGLGYEDQELTLEIRDEMGKLQINALIKEYPGREVNPDQLGIWQRLLGAVRDKAEEPPEGDQAPAALINSLIDWLDDRDDDAVTGLSGAESDYYRSLGLPYGCGNRPFTHISELFLVKGMTPERILGARGARPETQGLDPERKGEAVKTLKPRDLISVHGVEQENTTLGRFYFPGKINVNTAEIQVLETLLPAGSEDMAKELAEHRIKRTEEEGAFLNTLEKGWVANMVPMSEKEKEVFDRSVRYSSTLFRVHARGRENQAQADLSALIIREKDTASGQWQCRILLLQAG